MYYTTTMQLFLRALRNSHMKIQSGPLLLDEWRLVAKLGRTQSPSALLVIACALEVCEARRLRNALEPPREAWLESNGRG